MRIPRTRTKRAASLAHSNSRYLLGALAAMAYPRASLSLDMFAHEQVCRQLAVLEGRRLGAERRYQVASRAVCCGCEAGGAHSALSCSA